MIEKRYARTWLGFTWIPLRPALQVFLQILVFGGLLSLPSQGQPYIVFATVGIAAWTLLERTGYWATRSLDLNRSMLRRVSIPRVVVLLSAVVPGLMEFSLYLLIAAIAVVVYVLLDTSVQLGEPGVGILVGIAGVITLSLFGLAIGLWTSVFAARARDLRFSYGYFTGFWFFITPILYPASAIPERFRFLNEYNPATAPIDAVKYSVLGTPPPDLNSIVVTLVVLVVLGTGGMWFFGRAEKAAADHN